MDRRRVLASLAGLPLGTTLTACAGSGTTQGDESPATPSASGDTRSAAVASPRPRPQGGDGKATAATYDWFEMGSRLSEGAGLTWVQALTPQAVARRLEARPLGRHTWPENNWYNLLGPTHDEAVVAITELSGWALVVEDMNAFVTDDQVLARLSQDTRLVGAYENAGPDGRFVLAEDGVIQVDFEPCYAAERAGTQPDRLLADMRAVGLDLSAEQVDPADPSYPYVDSHAAALALAERVTGVALTAHVLHTSTYQAFAVPNTGGGAVNEEPEIRRAGP